MENYSLWYSGKGVVNVNLSLIFFLFKGKIPFRLYILLNTLHINVTFDLPNL